MSSCPEQALFATGSYLNTVFVFDSRSGKKRPIKQYQPHIGAVTRLAMNSEFILSFSIRDNSASIWDQRAGRIMKHIAVISCISTILRKEDIYDMQADFVDFRQRVSYVYEHTTGLCLRRGQRRQVARI